MLHAPCRYQARIEALGLEIQLLYRQRQEGGTASKENKRINKRAQRKRGQLRELLSEMYIWMCLATNNTLADVAYTEEQVQALWTEGKDAPWAVGRGAGNSMAVRMHYGRLYHTASADEQRAVEEMDVLRKEHARLLRWLFVADFRLKEAMQRHGAMGNVGAVHLLQQQVERMRRLSARANSFTIPPLPKG